MGGNLDSVDLIECSLADRIDCLVDFDCCQIVTMAVTMCLADCMFAALVDSIRTVVYLAVKMGFHWMLTVVYYCYHLTMFLVVAGDTHCRTRRIDCLWTAAAAIAVAAVAGAAAFVYCQIAMVANWFGAVAAAYSGNCHCNRSYSMSKVVS